jgi:hypothetical protein
MLAPAVLWTELTPGSHVVQFCDDDSVLLDTLEAFCAGGLLLGEAVIVIATAAHLAALRQRLRARDMDLATLQIFDQLIALDAEETLKRFMRDGQPDAALFEALAGELLERARTGGRPVRAFGEMVQLLWERGQHDATLQLERIWQRICHAEQIPLLCAYRKDSFTSDDSGGIRRICQAHCSVIS